MLLLAAKALQCNFLIAVNSLADAIHSVVTHITATEKADSRFDMGSGFFGESKAESSTAPGEALPQDEDPSEYSSDDDSNQNPLNEDDTGIEDDNESREQTGDFVEGMLPIGFSGPSKVVKPLTSEALAVFQVAQERAGVIYISRIPPGMRPAKVRHLMSGYGEIGRVYLQQEGAQVYKICTMAFVLSFL